MCDMTHSCVWHDSCTCVTWLIHVCRSACSYVWHDSCILTNGSRPHRSQCVFICVTWLMHTHEWKPTPRPLRTFICVTWLIHVCNIQMHVHDMTMHKHINSLHMHIQTDMHTYIHAHIHVYILWFTFMQQTCLHTCSPTYIQTCEHINMHLYSDMHTYIHSQINEFIRIYTFMHLYSCIHAHSRMGADPTTTAQDSSRRNFAWSLCHTHTNTRIHAYGVATISRLLKIIGLFCRISSLL